MKNFSQFSLLLLLLSVPPAFAADENDSACVILLHGLYRSGYSMKAVEWHLEEDYHVVNISYPSLFFPIEELADTAIEEGLAGCRLADISPIHFVTHSMGGILVRQYLAHHEIPELGRVVMMGPPNQGSKFAANLIDNPMLDIFLPVAATQLAAGAESLPALLGPVAYPVGIIAGSNNNRPWTPSGPIGPSDGTVLVEETRVAGMTDFITVPASHSFLMWHDFVLEQVSHFLNHGSFRHTGEEE
ncbi:alpha/beta fold hydrolase [Pseudohalioglobus lutimaris]|uniref:Alpha/beta hydrolase n=1 Tax=Pseudohalioglobus lutimaris TaxID=1737061 RepID=A0A2N5X5C9_9GAMM|nr:alpha/beta fold hydrolase [Pseudohalioglobus lutimaris]PLW69687.1 alpha/beta hydrolase [Pseudohalioglobus lutimaris]